MIRNKFSRKLKIALVAAGSIVLVACGMHHSMEHKMEKVFDRVAYKLDFNDEQRGLLDEIRVTVKQAREQTKPQRDQRRQDMLALFKADELDVERLQEIMQEKHQHMSDLAPQVMPLVKQLHGTLTVEQKDKVIKLMSHRFKHNKNTDS